MATDKLPYQAIEYLESTGNQVIDTGVLSDNDSQFSLICDLQKTRYSSNNDFYGANGNLQMRLSLINDNNRHIYEVWREHDYGPVSVIDGNIVRTDAFHTYVGYSICLFALGMSPGSRPAHFTQSKLYRATLSVNNVLVRDLIPVYRKSDGKPGMWDIVTETFFVNSGSGADFNVGPDAN